MKTNLRLLLLMGMIFIFGNCAKPPTIQAVKVSLATVESTVTTISSGTVKAENQAALSFGVAGRVKTVNVKAGQRVKKDMLLAELENRDLKSTAETASKEIRRSERLLESSMVSQAAFDEVKRAADVAQANYDRSVIRAPFDGIITEVNLKIGEMSTAGSIGVSEKPGIRIIDDKARMIEGDIDELDLGKIKVGQSVRVRIPAANNRRVQGQVTNTVPFINSIREQDRTSRIEIRLDENDPTIPVGASAEVEILVDKRDKVLALPARAILGVGKEKYVYRVVDDRLIKTSIVLGIGNYDRREIKSGLNEGDLAALPSNTTEIKDQLKVKVEVQPWTSSN